MAVESGGEWMVALTGASGQAYGIRLLEALADRASRVWVVATERAREIARHETGVELTSEGIRRHLGPDRAERVDVRQPDDWSAPFASGSCPFAGVVAAPCSMGTLARIAAGVSGTVIERAFDVALKERRPAVVVPRETPLSLLHLENMTRFARSGGIVLPASPGFYHGPTRMEELVDFVVSRVLAVCGLGPGASPPPWSGWPANGPK
jgi:4-hydroxy-3-polyprenylbenzoate decarboxylase